MNKKEMIETMIDGKTLYSKRYNLIAYFDPNERYPFRSTHYKGERSEPLEEWDLDWEIQKEWYEDIPEEGILCWCSSSIFELYIEIVTDYIKDNDYPFITLNDDEYKQARPLTPKEIEKYIYKGGLNE
jgi:hypothetical protein